MRRENAMSEKDLMLYINPNCPFCRKVMKYMDESGIEGVPTKDVREDGVRDELRGIGGKTQVPALVIDGEALYESDAIIEWMEGELA